MNGPLLRLAFSGIRARVLASVLTVMIAAAVAATVVIALEVGATGRDPWQQTFEAAGGADVIANVPQPEDALAIAARPGVAEAGRPEPRALATLIDGDEPVGVALQGLDEDPVVNRPVLTDGALPKPGAVLLEQSLARALGLHAGDVIDLVRVPAGQAPGAMPTARDSAPVVTFTVSGTAVVPSQPRFPRSNPGLVWVTTEDLTAVQPDRSTWRWSQAVRLDDPGSADEFATGIVSAFDPGTVSASTKAQQRADALLDTQPVVLIISTYTVVLLTVAFAVAMILVGTRARQQSREIGLLKAIGLTPRQVGRLFAAESGFLGLVGAGAGFALGVPLAPILAGSLADTMVAAPVAAAEPWHAVAAAVPVVLVLAVGTWLATLRQSRMSVVMAINAGATTPARHSAVAHLAGRLGLRPSVELGLRNLLTVRSRAVMLGLALVVTGAALVFALSVKASLDVARDSGPSDVPDGLPLVVYSLDVVLVLIAALGLIAVTLLTVRERMREFGILKTLGFTPVQISLSVTGGNAVVALVAGLVSLPTGAALYAFVYAATGGPRESRVFASAGSLGLVVIGLIVLALLATILPARLAGRVVVADALRHD